MRIIDSFLNGRSGSVTLNDGERNIICEFAVDENALYNREYRRLGSKTLLVSIIKDKQRFYALEMYNGTLLSDKLYSGIDFFDTKENLAPVRDESRNWGFINLKGEEVIPCQYEQPYKWYKDEFPYFFSCGMIVLTQKDKTSCEVCDNKGRVVVPSYRYQIDSYSVFTPNQRLKVRKNNEFLYGYIDTCGKEVIPLIYRDVSDFFLLNGYWRAIVATADSNSSPYKWFLIDEKGLYLAGPYRGFYPPEEGRIAAITLGGQIVYCQ